MIDLQSNEFKEEAKSDGYNHAIKNGLFSQADVAKMSDINILRILTSEDGIKALEEKLITADQALEMKEDTLFILTTENGRKALEDQLISIKQAMQLTPHQLFLLTSDIGRTALTWKLMTVNQFKDMDAYSLSILMTQEGLRAMSMKIISADQVMANSNSSIYIPLYIKKIPFDKFQEIFQASEKLSGKEKDEYVEDSVKKLVGNRYPDLTAVIINSLKNEMHKREVKNAKISFFKILDMGMDHDKEDPAPPSDDKNIKPSSLK